MVGGLVGIRVEKWLGASEAHIHTYLHTYIPTYLHTYPIDTDKDGAEGSDLHVPGHLHTYIHTYPPTHTYPIDTDKDGAEGSDLHVRSPVVEAKEDALGILRSHCR